MAYIGKIPTAAALTSSDISDGIITNAKLAQDIISADTALGAEPADTDEFLVSDAGTLKRLDYSYIKDSGGITEGDSWRLTTTFTNSASPIASNWERSDTNGQGNFGTGMSESSGIFTFPSTGWWHITFTAEFYGNLTSVYNGAYIVGTINNSSYANLSGSQQFIHDSPSGNKYSSPCTSTLFDVTSTTNCKVRFDVDVANTLVTINASSTQDITTAKFIRLGDT